jgi:hypothetical protein
MRDDGKCDQQSGFTYEISSEESVSEGVIKAVSTVSGADTLTEMTSGTESGRALEPLYTVIDPDALDSVFRTRDGDTDRRVTFPYHGYEVTVRNADRICVSRPEPANRGATD